MVVTVFIVLLSYIFLVLIYNYKELLRLEVNSLRVKNIKFQSIEDDDIECYPFSNVSVVAGDGISNSK